jgi:hypothetical protein
VTLTTFMVTSKKETVLRLSEYIESRVTRRQFVVQLSQLLPRYRGRVLLARPAAGFSIVTVVGLVVLMRRP